jgi:hypothetical protein
VVGAAGPVRHTIPAGEVKYLTVDVKTLQANQREHKTAMGRLTKGQPPCWIQVGDDKQNKINCFHIYWKMEGGSYAKMQYGHPSICGAMVYVETDAELEYEV